MDGFNPVQYDKFFEKKKLFKKKVVGLKVRPNPLICSLVYETGRERKPETQGEEGRNAKQPGKDTNTDLFLRQKNATTTPQKHRKLQERTSDLGIVTKVRSA